MTDAYVPGWPAAAGGPEVLEHAGEQQHARTLERRTARLGPLELEHVTETETTTRRAARRMVSAPAPAALESPAHTPALEPPAPAPAPDVAGLLWRADGRAPR